jgi:hypothetical protein
MLPITWSFTVLPDTLRMRILEIPELKPIGQLTTAALLGWQMPALPHLVQQWHMDQHPA